MRSGSHARHESTIDGHAELLQHCGPFLSCCSARGPVCTACRELAYVLGDAAPAEVLVARPEHHELLAPLAADVDAHMRVRSLRRCCGCVGRPVGRLTLLTANVAPGVRPSVLLPFCLG